MNEGSSTAISLLNRARRKDPQAWECLVRIYGPMVFAWGRRSGLSAEDAADIMQTVFVSLTTKLEGFRDPGHGTTSSFRGWLWTITRNKIHDLFRERQGKAQGIGGSSALRRLESLPADDSGSISTRAEIQYAWLEALRVAERQFAFAPHTWQAFWQTVIEHRSPQEVADDLGMTIWGVYKARTRVLQRLRQEFGELL